MNFIDASTLPVVREFLGCNTPADKMCVLCHNKEFSSTSGLYEQVRHSLAMGMEDRSSLSKTILVVDDQQEIRTLVARILSDHGYTVLTADSGEAAMQQSREYKNAIICCYPTWKCRG